MSEEVKNETVETKKTVTKQQPKAKAAQEKKETVIYMGPSIRNVAASGTVYNNGIPKSLKELADAHPVIGKLIVPVEKLSDAKLELSTDKTALSVCYEKALSLMNEKEE